MNNRIKIILAGLLLVAAVPAFALPPPGGGDDEGGGGTITATLTATPASVASGQSSTLTWSSTYATSCSGTNFATSNATSGSVSVSPDSTTTYTVTCTGSTGTAANSKTVTVTPPPAPTATLNASPSSIASWQSSTLTWSSTNATSCTGTNFSTGGATSGSSNVSPNQTTTYTVTCTGNGGSGSQSTTVTVTDDEGYTTTTYSGAECSGGTALGTYTDSHNACVSYCAGLAASCCTTASVSNAFEETTYTCSAFSNTSATSSRSSTSQCVPPGSEMCVYRSWSATLLSYAPAVTASLVTNPGTIHAGESALLTWSSANATSCTGVNFSTGGALSGSVSVMPSASTDYTVTCTNGSGSFDGTASDTETVTVENPGVLTVQCVAAPNPGTIGEPVTWSSEVSGGYDYTYSWSGSDSLTGTAASVQKTYGSLGQKTATLTVTSTEPTTYQLVQQGVPYFTKVCSGGTNNTNVQGQACEDFSCNAGTEGDSCKVMPSDCPEGGAAEYHWITRYECTAVGGGQDTVSTQCGSGLSCQFASCMCEGEDCGVVIEEGDSIDMTVHTTPTLYSGLNESGSTVTFRGFVENSGSSSIDEIFPNRFQVDIDNDGSYNVNLDVADDEYLIELSGSTAVISSPWANIPAGTHSVRLCADIPNTVDEEDEGNNCGPDLTFSVTDSESTEGNVAVDISVSTWLVRNGQQVTVTWTSEGDIDSCTVSGPGLSSSAGSGSASVTVTQESIYAITCSGDGGTASDSASVRLVPKFLEF